MGSSAPSHSPSEGDSEEKSDTIAASPAVSELYDQTGVAFLPTSFEIARFLC
jgi:hypothetical protein